MADRRSSRPMRASPPGSRYPSSRPSCRAPCTSSRRPVASRTRSTSSPRPALTCSSGPPDLLLESGEIDALLVIYVAPYVTRADEIAAAVARAAAATPDIPVAACLLGLDDPPAMLPVPGRPGVPTFTYPESAARALARAAWLGEWRGRPVGTVPPIAVDHAAVETRVAEHSPTRPRGLGATGGHVRRPGRLRHPRRPQHDRDLRRGRHGRSGRDRVPGRAEGRRTRPRAQDRRRRCAARAGRRRCRARRVPRHARSAGGRWRARSCSRWCPPASS